MSTQIDICNQALALVSEGSILSLDDNSTRARLCKTHCQASVREVLRSGQWRSARTRASLPMLREKPAFGWDHQYQLPHDFLRVITLNESSPMQPRCPLFAVEGDRLLCNESQVNLVYIRDLSLSGSRGTLSQLDPLTARAIATLLASKLAWPLQQSRTLRESLLQEYDNILREAKTANATDGHEAVEDLASTSEWFASRL